MINSFTGVGRLTRKPELKVTGGGTSVTRFTLAIDRDFKDENGNRKADFPNMVAWGKMAENFCTFADKGRLVGVTGRLETRTYDDKDGKRVYVTEVVINNFSFLDSRNQNQQAQNAPYNGGNATQSNYASQQGNAPQMNYQAPNKANNTFGGDPVNVSNDDLPF